MVNTMTLPTIFWDEGLSAKEELALAQAILHVVRQNQVAALLASSNTSSNTNTNYYVFIPNPVPYDSAEAVMFTALPFDLAQQVRSIGLPHAGKCYGVMGDTACLALMPHAFHLGPPELTVLAFPSTLICLENEIELARHISAQLARRDTEAAPREIVGLHFDSGDLLEIF